MNDERIKKALRDIFEHEGLDTDRANSAQLITILEWLIKDCLDKEIN